MLVFKFCNFLLFSPLFSFLKGLFTIVQAFYFLCREAFMLLKGRRRGLLDHFLSFPKAVWSDFSPKREAKPEIKGTFPGDKRGVP